MLNTTYNAKAMPATESVAITTLRELFQATPLYLFVASVRSILTAKR